LTHADGLDHNITAGPALLELFVLVHPGLLVPLLFAFGKRIVDAVEIAEVAAVDYAEMKDETGEGARGKGAAGESEDENLCRLKDELLDGLVMKTTRPSPGIQLRHNHT
jgi:hypothetical protein